MDVSPPSKASLEPLPSPLPATFPSVRHEPSQTSSLPDNLEQMTPSDLTGCARGPPRALPGDSLAPL